MRLSTDNIYSATDFRNDIFRHLDGLNDKPIILTRGGKSIAVVIAPKAFEEIMDKLEVLTAIDEGIEGVRVGDLVEHEKFMADMEKHFEEKAKAK